MFLNHLIDVEERFVANNSSVISAKYLLNGILKGFQGELTEAKSYPWSGVETKKLHSSQRRKIAPNQDQQSLLNLERVFCLFEFVSTWLSEEIRVAKTDWG